jgi:hypothetical protein
MIPTHSSPRQLGLAGMMLLSSYSILRIAVRGNGKLYDKHVHLFDMLKDNQPTFKSTSVN